MIDRFRYTPLRPTSTRRAFLEGLAASAGALILSPASLGCASSPAPAPPPAPGPAAADAPTGPMAVPFEPDHDWDAVAFNRRRGNLGAIPASYLPKVNGPDGDTQHVGKHLPYVPDLQTRALPSGLLAVMWGDPARGRARHPNAAPGPTNPSGHFFDWIRVRKVTHQDTQELDNRFTAWPVPAQGDTGAYAAKDGSDPAADEGRNTVYLVHLSQDVRGGDLVRVYGHCRTHGEFVDFVRVPG